MFCLYSRICYAFFLFCRLGCGGGSSLVRFDRVERPLVVVMGRIGSTSALSSSPFCSGLSFAPRFCSSTTYADVLPPTVTHFIVATSPDSSKSLDACSFRLPLPCPSMIKQPVRWELGRFRVRGDSRLADVLHFLVQLPNLALAQRVALLLRVHASMV